jgi:hypothetical protein
VGRRAKISKEGLDLSTLARVRVRGRDRVKVRERVGLRCGPRVRVRV